MRAMGSKYPGLHKTFQDILNNCFRKQAEFGVGSGVDGETAMIKSICSFHGVPRLGSQHPHSGFQL